MKSFMVGLFLGCTVLTTTPAAAQPGWEAKLVRSLGCTADVFSTPAYPGFNAYYSPGLHVIVLLNLAHLPLDWQRLIVIHETGHCLQFQDGTWEKLRARGPYELEWDADRFAIRVLADRYGIDGADLNHDIWAAVYRQFGFEGSDTGPHGTLVGRITRGHLNRVLTTHQGA